MKLSAKSEYAFLALIYLARKSEQGLLKIKEIAEAQKIPKKYLEQILIVLKRAGYVKSKAGANGGYCLGRSPTKINLAEIIRLIDGALAPIESVSKYFYAPTPLEREEGMMRVLRKLRDHIAKVMETTTLAQIINNVKK